MNHYLLRRLLVTIPTIIGITMLIFAVIVWAVHTVADLRRAAKKS